ncbi:MAG TPA: SPOR domain-containing protein [Burkholderiales bacterium]|nr:SPOR domain-containing protein [Burkholderiales bacterium]
MAKTSVSDEELQLRKRARRRLVGAIGLVLLVVVLVPMLLDRGPRQQKQDIDIRIPPVPAQTQAPAPSALPVPGAAQPAAPAPDAATTTPVTPAPPTSAATQAGTPVNPPPQPVPQSAPPAAAPEAQTVSRAADQSVDTHAAEQSVAPREEYVIRLGAFADRARAKDVLAKVKAEKVAAYSESVKTPHGLRVRVRAGPFPSMQAAEKAKEQLKAAKLLPGNDAKIVRKGE